MAWRSLFRLYGAEQEKALDGVFYDAIKACINASLILSLIDASNLLRTNDDHWKLG